MLDVTQQTLALHVSRVHQLKSCEVNVRRCLKVRAAVRWSSATTSREGEEVLPSVEALHGKSPCFLTTIRSNEVGKQMLGCFCKLNITSGPFNSWHKETLCQCKAYSYYWLKLLFFYCLTCKWPNAGFLEWNAKQMSLFFWLQVGFGALAIWVSSEVMNCVPLKVLKSSLEQVVISDNPQKSCTPQRMILSNCVFIVFE